MRRAGGSLSLPDGNRCNAVWLEVRHCQDWGRFTQQQQDAIENVNRKRWRLVWRRFCNEVTQRERGGSSPRRRMMLRLPEGNNQFEQLEPPTEEEEPQLQECETL